MDYELGTPAQPLRYERNEGEIQFLRVDISECSHSGGQSAVYPVEVVAANLVSFWFWAAVVGDISNERCH